MFFCFFDLSEFDLLKLTQNKLPKRFWLPIKIPTPIDGNRGSPLKQGFEQKKDQKIVFLNVHVRYEKSLLTTYKHPQSGPFPPHGMWETFKPFSKSAKNTIFWGS